MTIQTPQTLTRSAALEYARHIFGQLALRAFDAAGDDAAYVVALTTAWVDRLAGLASDPTPLTIDDAKVFDDLTLVVSDTTLSASDLIEWVDAYPAAMANLFASSAIEVSGEFETNWVWYAELDEADTIDADEVVDAGNRQPALALAA
jgi:hypothetical protein